MRRPARVVAGVVVTALICSGGSSSTAAHKFPDTCKDVLEMLDGVSMLSGNKVPSIDVAQLEVTSALNRQKHLLARHERKPTVALDVVPLGKWDYAEGLWHRWQLRIQSSTPAPLVLLFRHNVMPQSGRLFVISEAAHAGPGECMPIVQKDSLKKTMTEPIEGGVAMLQYFQTEEPDPSQPATVPRIAVAAGRVPHRRRVAPQEADTVKLEGRDEPPRLRSSDTPLANMTKWLPTWQSEGAAPDESGDASWGDSWDESRDARCALTTGTWCAAFLSGEMVPAKEPPHGNKTCLRNCSGPAHVCNYDTGLCDCTAGYTGDYCQYRQKRPCTDAWRPYGAEAWGTNIPANSQGWTASRCSGICDEDTAECYCTGTFGREPAPEGSPPGTPPIKEGRPLSSVHCQSKRNPDGGIFERGHIEHELLFGEKGWCESDKPAHTCPCLLDGRGGQLCDEPVEQFCLNQCSGHGECKRGFCMCRHGYYGHDCARRVQGLPDRPGIWNERPWLVSAMEEPWASKGPPVINERPRPLIYVYDLPPDYNTRLLQYRVDKGLCVHRIFYETNQTALFNRAYAIETALHEMFLQSPHRTLDPEEADFFYVPVYTTCLLLPVSGFADHPWYYGPTNYRIGNAINMAVEAKRWVENHHPWWRRRGGADHIWLFSADEGACWAPREIYDTSIILSHWGRKDPSPESATAYVWDNYSATDTSRWNFTSWHETIGNHPCYSPGKDLAIPVITVPEAIGRSPLLGYPAVPRSILLFFRGDFRIGYPNYSRGIRQKLKRLADTQDWKNKYNVYIGTREDIPGPYDRLLSRSVFCVVAPGDGYSTRVEDAVLHGCIPVIIMDDVDPVFGSILDWDRFSVRVKQDELEELPERLGNLGGHVVRRLQENLAKVWHRFMYSSAKIFDQQLEAKRKKYAKVTNVLAVTTDMGEGPKLAVHDMFSGSRWATVGSATGPLPGVYSGPYGQDDAFHTILAWLFSRINATRGSPST